jgi:hypothetical protein
VPGAPPFVPAGLATGIGSLPHEDPDAAVGAVLRHLPQFPFWPQLPKRSPLEGMTLQYLEGFPGLREAGAGRDPFVETGEAALGEVESFYDRALGGDPADFSLSPERAAGFYTFEERLVQAGTGVRYVKGHVTGPVTLATSLRDRTGREIAYDDTFREVVAAFVARKASWQAGRLAALGVPVILFLDEPVMEVFGSAYSALTAEMVSSLWAPALADLRRLGAVSGIHCCGNTDWELLFGSGVGIVNFDAYHYLDRLALYAGSLKGFLEEGGVLAWGIVPTSAAALGETPESLLSRLGDGIDQLSAIGIDRGLLRAQCLLTPSCGMGSLDPPLAERILELLAELSRRFRG